jgi:mannitol-specific phosphotransferase system IIBC component
MHKQFAQMLWLRVTYLILLIIYRGHQGMARQRGGLPGAYDVYWRGLG